jgi:hypothetical protein
MPVLPADGLIEAILADVDNTWRMLAVGANCPQQT